MSSRPSTKVITLTTDFGLNDHFAGTMKGVILDIAPKARIVDITHGITPFNIAEAAFEIRNSWVYFPPGTIHVVVVDPGVGTARRPILAECSKQFFIGPDNGVFSLAWFRDHTVREITNPEFMEPSVSRTFHGRDIFAPVAAHLALGIAPERFGELITDPVHLALEPVKLPKSWRGMVVKADRFGNIVTNFHIRQFQDVKTAPIKVRIAKKTVRQFAPTYADIEPGELAVLEGSSGYLEIVANQTSAAQLLGCKGGDAVDLVME
jgi:S-adenosyl-L-methionine hydrolase (adenosine-forming)